MDLKIGLRGAKELRSGCDSRPGKDTFCRNTLEVTRIVKQTKTES